MPRLNASRLRSDIYRVLDRVIETGESVEIVRRGHVVRLVAERPTSKLDRLVKRPGFIRGSSGEIADVEWSKSWRP